MGAETMLHCVDLSKSTPDSILAGGLALTERRLRFGPFELRLDTRELSKLGNRIKLQSKPAQVLAILASRPGELVRRDELCSQLWPDGVFVDVESGLNTAMNRLRAVLGDTAEEPFYIETIPRLGYRFICPVQDGSMPLPAEPPETSIDLPSSAFPENMFLRLAVATLLALACQFVVFYLDLPAAISRACVIK